MSEDRVIDAMASGLFTIILAASPPLILGLAVGLMVSIFQTVTSIQEQTLAFVPKIIAVMASLIIFGPFILSTIVGFFRQMVINLPYFVVPM